MIIHNLYVVRVAVLPNEANPPLAADSDAVHALLEWGIPKKAVFYKSTNIPPSR